MSAIMSIGGFFEIKPSEIWGVLGANGVGKSRLLHALAGLAQYHKPIYFNHKNLNTYDPKIRAQSIGFLPQETPDYLTMSVLQLCQLGRHPHTAFLGEETDKENAIIQSVLEDMSLTSLQHRMLDTLSGGERKRAHIACLLAQSPLLYLLDEPTNHLDLAYQYRVLSHFKKLTKETNHSVVMSLHNPQLASIFCDQVLLLFKNNTYLTGSAHALLNKKNIAQLYECPEELLDHFGLANN